MSLGVFVGLDSAALRSDVFLLSGQTSSSLTFHAALTRTHSPHLLTGSAVGSLNCALLTGAPCVHFPERLNCRRIGLIC